MKPIKLGVNIDHIATVRQARGTSYPSLIEAAQLAEEHGADGITIHLREDRRHIQDSDVYRLSKTITTKLNLEMAMTDEMLEIARDVKPACVCLVPEKREELTTEGGLDVIGQFDRVKHFATELAKENIEVSLFIDPDIAQINMAFESGAPTIEIHTGDYANVPSEENLKVIHDAVMHAHQLGLIVNAGHGLHEENVSDIAKISVIHELNIGHAIVAKALMIGLPQAVSSMKKRMIDARRQ